MRSQRKRSRDGPRFDRQHGIGIGEPLFITAVSQTGDTIAAPLPPSGQIAPNMSTEAAGWSRGADGRLPRPPERQVILVFRSTRVIAFCGQVTSLSDIRVSATERHSASATRAASTCRAKSGKHRVSS